MRYLKFLTAFVVGHFASSDSISSLSKFIFLGELLDTLKIDEVIDVGANVGQFATSMRWLGFKGRIESFEPIPEDFETLTRTMGHDPGWAGHNLALSDSDGLRQLNVMRSTVYSSFNRPIDDQDGANTIVRTIPVAVRRLDGVLGPRDLNRTLLKVDTQGHELAVLRGLGQRLAQVRAVMCEASVNAIYAGTPPIDELLSYLGGFDFKPAFYGPVGRERNFSAREFDVICVRT